MNVPKQIREIFDQAALKPTQATYMVYARATYYPDFTEVYIPNVPYPKQEEGVEARKQPYGTSENPVPKDTEEDIERSLRRSKKQIKAYELCNQFELFATFTFKDGRQDIKLCKRRMADWLKNQQKRNGKFQYLVVPEFHKDGVSLHFHALLKGYTGKLKPAINPHTGQELTQKTRTIYTIPSYRSGFTNVVKIEDSPESRAKVGSYIRKYITKDMPRLFGQNRYWASHDLKLPPSEDNPPNWYVTTKADEEYVGEFGVIKYFRNNRQSLAKGQTIPREFIGD